MHCKLQSLMDKFTNLITILLITYPNLALGCESPDFTLLSSPINVPSQIYPFPFAAAMDLTRSLIIPHQPPSW